MALTRPKASQIITTSADFSDPLILINKDQTGANDKDIGFVFERGSDTNVAIIWDESEDQFALINTTETGSTNGNVNVDSYSSFKVGAFVTTVGTITGTSAVTLTATSGNLGLVATGANIITASTNDVERLRITGTGSMGLGTSSPSAKFESNITASETALTAVRFNLNSAASAGETIPVTNPNLELRRGSDQRGAFVKFINQRTGYSGIGANATTNDGYDLRFHTGTGSESVRIDSAGNTGFGTSSPGTFGKNVTNGDIATLARGLLKFYDTDSSHYVAFRSASTVNNNITWTLPAADGNSGQVLGTDGAGNLSWTAGGGGGASSGFINSTITTAPGAGGNYDLAEGPNQDGDETPFEASGTDAFGVSLGSVYDAMEPTGSIVTIDYADGEAHVGA